MKTDSVESTAGAERGKQHAEDLVYHNPTVQRMLRTANLPTFNDGQCDMSKRLSLTPDQRWMVSLFMASAYSIGRDDSLKSPCTWTYDEHTSSWDTQCDEKFQFSHEGIKENNARFCQYCGGQIIEIANKSQE